ncbi:MAG: hypothetical protein U9Q77_11380, partial [Candidatus Marinimicrobia bacterium]|nr:hypothetical protein [Candidatus Neomarinimicrobiota bacterium]
MAQTATAIQGTKKENIAIMKRARGKTLSFLLKNNDIAAASRWLRVYDQTHNDRSYRIISPEGGVHDYAKIKSGRKATSAWGSYNEIAKVLSILTDGRAENIFYQIGREHKVRNFYNNLFAPNSDMPFATIDTHAVAAALFRPLAVDDVEVRQAFGSSGSSSSSITGQKGTYSIFLEVYKRAAEQRGLRPREMQSMAWEAIRGLFEDNQKTKKTKAFASETWEKFSNGEISQQEAREAINDLFGGVTNPAWVNTEYSREVVPTYTGAAQANINYRANGESAPSSPVNIMLEVAPDPNNIQLTAEWDALPESEKLRISQSVAATIIEKTLKEFGTDGDFSLQFGGYMGATNPSMMLTVERAELAIPVAKMLGYVLSQDSMMVTSEDSVVGTSEVGVVTIALPDGYGAIDIENLYDTLYELEEKGKPIVGGHSTRDGQMAILNSSNVKDYDLAKRIEEKIGRSFQIDMGKVNAAFPQKEEYDYDSNRQEASATTKGTPILRRADTLRNQATRELEQELRKTKESKSETLLYQGSQDQLGFYSALTKAAHDIKQNSLPAKSWVNALLKQPNVKKQEIEAVGLQEWLDMQDSKVSRESVIAFLDQGGVQIEEVTKGVEGFDENNPTLPANTDLAVVEAPEDFGSEFAYGVVYGGESTVGLGHTEEEAILDAYSGHPEYWEE